MSPSKDLCITGFDNKTYYKASTRAKTSSKRNSWRLISVKNHIFLSNRFRPTEGIWRLPGGYKYCHKINNIALIYCLFEPSSLYCSILFYLIFSSVFLLSILPLLFFFFSPGLCKILWEERKISAPNVRRRGRCVYYSVRTKRYHDVMRNCSAQAVHDYIL
jgi:hypothetical protein